MSGGWKSAHENICAGSFATFLARGYTVCAVEHGSQPKFTLAEIVPTPAALPLPHSVVEKSVSASHNQVVVCAPHRRVR